MPVRPVYSDDQIEPGSTEIRADDTRIVEQGTTHFSGDVEVIRNDQAIRGDLVTYDNVNSRVDVEGHAILWGPGLIWEGEQGAFDLDARTSRLEAGRYWLSDRRGRGIANLIESNNAENITRLSKVDYTTCPDGGEDWKFSARNIRLDHDTDRGSATNVLLKVRDVPVLYIPYINFPLSDKRKSGFLMPTFGTSNESGADVRVPYYWNIAPNHDATLTPRYIADRGAMFGGQYRYLFREFEGQFDFEYLQGDDLEGGKDRSLVSFRHQQFFAGRRGDARVLFTNVSDERYFEDFGQNMGVTAQRFLDRHIDFRYTGQRFRMMGLVQSYQSVDDSLPGQSGPYKRLPWIYVSSTLPYYQGKPYVSIWGDTTYFSRSDSVSGARVHVEPAVSMPFIRTYARIVPRIAVRHTEYFLDQPESFDDRASRTVPLFSVDSQLFAERLFSAFGSRFLQTLEPRLFYLLVPKVGQGDIPVFDTGLFDISFSNLFRDDRFTGRDRVGDTNQVSLAVSSRILDRDSGRELVRASVGQIHYFRDREVTLPGRIEENEDMSELIAELVTRIGSDWSVRGAVQYDPNESETEKAVFGLRYQPSLGAVVNLGYRLRRAVTNVEQADISLRWPITDRLSFVGRWNYSLRKNQSLETMGGIEYESCCWGVRLVSRRFIRNTQGEFDNAMFVQFELKGLGGFGQGTASFLRKSIPGYETYF